MNRLPAGLGGRRRPVLEGADDGAEFGDEVLIEPAFERHDQIGNGFQLDPLPVEKFRVLGGDVDVVVGAGEADQEPLLALAAKPAAP